MNHVQIILPTKVTSWWRTRIHLQLHIDGEGIVALYAAPNPFLLNKICLNQLHIDVQHKQFYQVFHILESEILYTQLRTLSNAAIFIDPIMPFLD